MTKPSARPELPSGFPERTSRFLSYRESAASNMDLHRSKLATKPESRLLAETTSSAQPTEQSATARRFMTTSKPGSAARLDVRGAGQRSTDGRQKVGHPHEAGGE